jgi:hypothetical protein
VKVAWKQSEAGMLFGGTKQEGGEEMFFYLATTQAYPSSSSSCPVNDEIISPKYRRTPGRCVNSCLIPKFPLTAAQCREALCNQMFSNDPQTQEEA